jgi:UDP-2,3-diacylglucosamine pyrophosphatase LpxH
VPHFPPHFDEIYVVSDIHMGGETSFQIFNRGARLASLVRHVAKERPDDEVAFVLNGDIVDSLAEDMVPGYVALDASGAVAMMERIYADPAFAPVWDALGEFVRTRGRTLVFVIGNHDIELALPPVEASIRERLCGGEAAANERIVFATHGGGFGCTVGTSRVFCTHGNEVDDWNTVDFSALGQLANAMNAGRRPDAADWTPNAGTRLVVDVMNEVKRRFPFVDLLKPETKPVVATLLTLDPGLVRKIELGSAYSVLRDKVRGRMETSGLLSAHDELETASPELLAASAAEELLGRGLAEAIARQDDTFDEDDLLLSAESALAQGKSPSDAIDDEAPETLGWTDIVSGWIGRIDKVEALRRALSDWLGGDATFEIGEKDETYERILARVGPEIDYVVTGHTHLARAIEFAPKRWYFNCGTWIRLLRLTKEALADEKTFRKSAYDAFESGRMEDLDDAKIPGPGGKKLGLVLDRTNVVRISDADGTVTGALLRVQGGDGRAVKLTPESGGLRS